MNAVQGKYTDCLKVVIEHEPQIALMQKCLRNCFDTDFIEGTCVLARDVSKCQQQVAIRKRQDKKGKKWLIIIRGKEHTWCHQVSAQSHDSHG